MPFKMRSLPTQVETDAEPSQEYHELEVLKDDMFNFMKALKKKKRPADGPTTDQTPSMGQTDSTLTSMLPHQAVGEVLTSASSLEGDVHRKLSLLDQAHPDHTAPPGWSSSTKGGKTESTPTKPVPESGPASISSHVSSPKPSDSKLTRTVSEPEFPSQSGSLSYPVTCSDCDIELSDKDLADMPDTLRVPNADVFLITSEQDEYGGRRLKELLEELEIRIDPEKKDGRRTKCRVYVLSDINTEQNKIKSIAQALEKCTYVFLLLTKSFCDDRWADFQKDEALVKSITTTEERRWGMVPLYTQPKRDGPPEKAYTIPYGLLSFKGLDMSRLVRDKESIESLKSLTDGDTYFKKGVTAMLESRIQLRLAREQQRLEDRDRWIEQKKFDIKKERLVKEHYRNLQQRSKEESLQRLLKGLPTELPQQPMDEAFEAEKEKWRSSSYPDVKTAADSSRPYPTQAPYHSPYAQGGPQHTQPSPFTHQFPTSPMPPGMPPVPPEVQQYYNQQFMQMMHHQFFMQQHPYAPGYGIPAGFAVPPYQLGGLSPHPSASPNPPGVATPGQAAGGEPAAHGHYVYNIQASNVQIGSSSTMVTNEGQANPTDQEDEDYLMRKYNTEREYTPDDCPLSDPSIVESPARDPPDKSSHLDNHPRYSFKKDPVERSSPQYPENHLQRDNLGVDASYPSGGSEGGRTRLTEEDFGMDQVRKPYSNRLPYDHKPKTPTESTDKEMTEKESTDKEMTKEDFAKTLGVTMRNNPKPDDKSATYSEQTLPKHVS